MHRGIELNPIMALSYDGVRTSVARTALRTRRAVQPNLASSDEQEIDIAQAHSRSTADKVARATTLRPDQSTHIAALAVATFPACCQD